VKLALVQEIGREDYTGEIHIPENATMYNPRLFREEDQAIIAEIIHNTRLATLVSNGPNGVPEISHLPLIYNEAEGPHGSLLGHFARANTHWRTIASAGKAIAIFAGPDAYVSPSWYPTKQEHHKHVPTWNYEVVHAICSVETFDDPARLREAVSRLTKRHEDHRAEPWTVEQAPEDYLASQFRAIVGIVLRVEQLEGKRKLSQNRAPQDRLGVREALARSADPVDRAIATRMTTLDSRGSHATRE
jgi:transcriptional regulator